MTIDTAMAHIQGPGDIDHSGLFQPEAAQHILRHLENSLRGQDQCFVHARTVTFSLWSIPVYNGVKRVAVSLARQLFGLSRKMTGDAHVEPALELGGQIKNLDSHGKIL